MIIPKTNIICFTFVGCNSEQQADVDTFDC